MDATQSMIKMQREGALAKEMYVLDVPLALDLRAESSLLSDSKWNSARPPRRDRHEESQVPCRYAPPARSRPGSEDQPSGTRALTDHLASL